MGISSFSGSFHQILSSLIKNSAIHGFNGKANGSIKIKTYSEKSLLNLFTAITAVDYLAMNISTYLSRFYNQTWFRS